MYTIRMLCRKIHMHLHTKIIQPLSFHKSLASPENAIPVKTQEGEGVSWMSCEE